VAKVNPKEDSIWSRYFASIKQVCPWSLTSYMHDKILFVDYSSVSHNTWSKLFRNTSHEAFVYRCEGKDVDWLVNKCEKLNLIYKTSEWLWSHPDEGGNSTPIPVLIQQDREQLENLRNKIGYNDE